MRAGNGTSPQFSGDPFDSGESGRQVVAGDLGVVAGLHVDEEHVARSNQGAGKPRGVGRDPALCRARPVVTPGRRIDRPGDAVLRDPHWFDELAQEDLPWMSGGEIYHGYLLPSALSKRLCTE